MKKINYFINEDKEEQWINDMCMQGFHLQKVRFGMYTFEKGEPGQYTYRLDYLQNFGFGREVAEYIDFVEGTGAQLVQKQFGWAYFRQHEASGTFTLYSDDTSKLKFINRLLAFYGAVIFISMLVMMLSSSLGILLEVEGITDFLVGMSTGTMIVLIVPTFLLYRRRRQLKKKTFLLN